MQSEQVLWVSLSSYLFADVQGGWRESTRETWPTNGTAYLQVLNPEQRNPVKIPVAPPLEVRTHWPTFNR
jgi:hypothetical protein